MSNWTHDRPDAGAHLAENAGAFDLADGGASGIVAEYLGGQAYKASGRDFIGNGGGRLFVTFTDANGNPDSVTVNYGGDYPNGVDVRTALSVDGTPVVDEQTGKKYTGLAPHLHGK